MQDVLGPGLEVLPGAPAGRPEGIDGAHCRDAVEIRGQDAAGSAAVLVAGPGDICADWGSES